MTSNNRLNLIELRRTNADGQQEMIRVQGRLNAIIEKLLSIGVEVEDKRTCQIVLHLGRRRREGFDVEVEWRKRD